ncbi:thioesterase family protein [Rheinheimera baltica]|uniref:Thioesterase family protein n=1 Tax=Rheinheimera baltica TaxID=67576 RepID=A0ABT9I207_9GAMM|nr:thioesterase family protein [Rheinheimera baltica]MDP5137422.1 thioesterase family protein [Rheinheimera baltica]
MPQSLHLNQILSQHMTHKTLIKVRGYHLDIYQHVNNARYLEFLEEARWGYLEDSGDIEWFAKHNLAWVIVNININYRVAATMGDTLEVFTRFSKVGGKSAVVTQEVRIAGKDAVAADAQVTFVCLDQKTGKAVAIEGELKARLEQHIAEA